MAEDQRFASAGPTCSSTRPSRSSKDLTLAGPIEADL